MMKPRSVKGSGFRGVLNYVLDEGLKATGKKKPEIISSNMAGKDAASLAREFGLVRALRPDVPKPVEHFTLSLPEGEKLSPEKWDAVVKDYLKGMGLDPNNHQYITAIHNDTHCSHVHIIVNRIRLDGKVKFWKGHNAQVNLMAEVARNLEVTHGLQITEGWGDDEIKKRATRGRETGKARRTGQVPERMELQAIVRDARDTAKSFPEFVAAIEAQGVRLVPNGKTGSVSGASFEYKGRAFPGSKLGDDCKWKPLAAAVGYDELKDAGLIAQLRASGEVAKQALRENVNTAELADAVMSCCLAKNSTFTADGLNDVLYELSRELKPEEVAKHEQRIKKSIEAYKSSIGKTPAGAGAKGQMYGMPARGLADAGIEGRSISARLVSAAALSHRSDRPGLRLGLHAGRDSAKLSWRLAYGRKIGWATAPGGSLGAQITRGLITVAAAGTVATTRAGVSVAKGAYYTAPWAVKRLRSLYKEYQRLDRKPAKVPEYAAAAVAVGVAALKAEDVLAVERRIKASMIEVGQDKFGNAIYTSRDMLTREVDLVERAVAMANDQTHSLSDEVIERAIAEKERLATEKIGKPVIMTDEQKEAVRHALKGSLSCVQGSAGAGKTFSIEAMKLALESQGYNMIGACVAKRAAQNLQDETGIESFTMSKLVNDLNRGTRKLNSKDVVIVDEAGQLGTGQIAALLEHAEKVGAKVILTGEDKQLDAIQHGGPLRFLSSVIGTARIEGIVRQDEQWARDAVMNYRDGKADAAFKSYEDRNLVSWVDGDQATKDRIIADWHAFEKANPGKQSLVLAHRNEDVRDLAARIREIRKTEGKVTGPEHTLQAVHGENEYNLTLAKGDRIRFTKNDEKGIGVINGLTGTVESIAASIDGKGFNLTVRTDDNRTVSFNSNDYCNENGKVCLSSAYAMTIYSSQGVTIRGDVFLYQSASMDRASTYVGASRAKGNTHFYVDQAELAVQARSDDPARMREQLIKNMSRNNFKTLAFEHLAERDPSLIKEIQDGYGARVAGEGPAKRILARLSAESGAAVAVDAGHAADAGRSADAEQRARRSIGIEDRAPSASNGLAVGRDQAALAGNAAPGAADAAANRRASESYQADAGAGHRAIQDRNATDAIRLRETYRANHGASRHQGAGALAANAEVVQSNIERNQTVTGSREGVEHASGAAQRERQGRNMGKGAVISPDSRGATDRVVALAVGSEAIRNSVHANDNLEAQWRANGARDQQHKMDDMHQQRKELPMQNRNRLSAALDAKVQAWRRQHYALQSPTYRITFRDRDQERIRERDDRLRAEGKRPDGKGHTYNLGKQKDGDERFFTAAEVEQQLGKMSRENARNFDVYITPVDPHHHYLVVDDLKGDALDRLRKDGYEPCLVMTSSKDNQQAILKIPKDGRGDEQSIAKNLSQRINQKYGDAEVVNIIQPFRTAGFSNKKASRASEFTIIDEMNPGIICKKANGELDEERRRIDAERLAAEQERQRKIEQAQEQARVQRQEALFERIRGAKDEKTADPGEAYCREAKKALGLAKSLGWSNKRGEIDMSVIDHRAGVAMAKQGWSAEDIYHGIRNNSPAIEDRHAKPDDYATRTVQSVERKPDVQTARAKQAAERALIAVEQERKRQEMMKAAQQRSQGMHRPV